MLLGTLGPDVVDIRTSAKPACSLSTPASWRLLPAIQDHLHRWRSGPVVLPWLPDRTTGENSDYLEVCYLLLNGELPTAEQSQVRLHRYAPQHAA